MGYITFYRCLISRQYDELEKFRRMVDGNYFAHCLYTAAQSAALNGMDVGELAGVLENYLGESYARQLRDYMERVHI